MEDAPTVSGELDLGSKPTRPLAEGGGTSFAAIHQEHQFRGFSGFDFFFFFLNMFLIARGLSKNGECSVPGTRNPAGVAAADTGHLPAWLDSSCLTVPLEQDARSCWQT